MVLCFVALFVFAFLGIFSAKYRGLAKEAFDCTVRTATLRPCQSNLDERIKATVIAKILEYSPSTARVINKNFQVISTLMVLVFFASMAYSAVSTYNYAVYGNCNGPVDTGGFCPYDVIFGKQTKPLTAIPPGVGPVLGSGPAVLLEVGCYSCPFTRSAQPALKEFLAKHPEVRLEFRVLPIPSHDNSFISAQAAFCAEEQGKFWEYHGLLFEDKDHSRENLLKMAGSLNLDAGKFNSCLDSDESRQRVLLDEEAGKNAGIYGTPTFFLNGSILVGPQPLQDFEDALAGRAANATGTGGVCPPPAA